MTAAAARHRHLCDRWVRTVCSCILDFLALSHLCVSLASSGRHCPAQLQLLLEYFVWYLLEYELLEDAFHDSPCLGHSRRSPCTSSKDLLSSAVNVSVSEFDDFLCPAPLLCSAHPCSFAALQPFRPAPSCSRFTKLRCFTLPRSSLLSCGATSHLLHSTIQIHNITSSSLASSLHHPERSRPAQGGELHRASCTRVLAWNILHPVESDLNCCAALSNNQKSSKRFDPTASTACLIVPRGARRLRRVCIMRMARQRNV